MKERIRLTEKQKVDIMNLYTNELIPMAELGRRFGVCRQAIHRILRHWGADTTKKPLMVSCTTCGKEVQRGKARIRRQLHHFCSQDCYFAFLEAGNGNPYRCSRFGQIIAREKVSQYFALQEGHIVHHEDRNTLNNSLENLLVFANQGDHVRHHRGFDVEPVWNGRGIKLKEIIRNRKI